MKKIFFGLSVIFLFIIIAYFNQDRTKLYTLISQNKQTNTKYQFSEQNHLNKIIFPNKIISYTIKGDGNRIQKSIDGKIVEKYSWLGDGKLHIVTDENSKILRQYLYKNEYANLPFGMITHGQKFYFIFNKMKSLRLVLNSNKQIVKILDYDKNGYIIKDTNPKLKIDFSYAGGLLDENTQLIFFLEGVYNPTSAQWISKIKNYDVIKNLKQLNNTNENIVYKCSATLDVYYHSYLCSKKQCGGLYATDYLNYFNGKGFIIDNSSYFNHDICKPIKLSNNYNQKKFANCVYEKIQPKKAIMFDVWKHNCHHEVKNTINFCLKQALKKEPYVN